MSEITEAVQVQILRVRAALGGGSGIGARLLRGSLLSAIIGATGVLLSFGTQLVLARALGPDDYGIYAIVLSWVGMLTVFGTLGLDCAALRFISAYAGLGQWDGVRRYKRYSYRAASMTSLGIALVVVLVLHLRQWSLDAPLIAALATLIVLLPACVMLQLQACILQGMGTVVGAQAPTAVARPAVFMALVAASIVIAGHRLAPTAVLLMNATAVLSCVGLSEYLLWRALRERTEEHAKVESGEWLPVSRSLLVASIVQLGATQQLGVFIIGLLRAPRDAGIYSAASQLALPLSLGVQAVIFVAAPILAQLHAQRRQAELQRTLRLAVLAAAAFVVPGFLVVVVIGKWLLGLYGPAFVAGYPILLTLLATQLFIALGGGIGNSLLAVTGHERMNVRFVSYAAISNLILCFILVRSFGMLGAALATAGAVGLRWLLVVSFVRRDLGLSLLPFGSSQVP